MLSQLRVLDQTDGGARMAGRIPSDLGAEVVLEDDAFTESVIAGGIE